MSFKKTLAKVTNILTNNKTDKNKTLKKPIYTKRLDDTRKLRPKIEQYFSLFLYI